MASLTLTLDKDHPAHGETVTATYAVLGNDGTPERSASISGTATVGDQPLTAAVVVTFPAVDPLPVTYDAPTVAGLTFTATKNPTVFTAVVP
jgi:hypothetical protein